MHGLGKIRRPVKSFWCVCCETKMWWREKRQMEGQSKEDRRFDGFNQEIFIYSFNHVTASEGINLQKNY